MKREALIPLEQALIPFHGGEILAVRLLNGIIGVTLVSLCNLLKIAKWPQLRRLREDEALSKHLLLVIVDTPGGPQATEILTAQAIPTWLTGLQPSMVAPEKRPMILALKEEAIEVLYHHFFHIDPEPPPPPQTEQPTVSSDSPAQLIAAVAQAMGEAAQRIVGAVQTMSKIAQLIDTQQAATQEARQVMSARLTALEGQREAQEEWQQAMGEHLIATREQQEVLQARQQAMGDYLVNVRERQEVVEERWEAIGDYVVEARERVIALEQQRRGAPDSSRANAPPSGGPNLSPQHLAQLFALAREARRQRGTPVSEQLAALAEALGVPDVSDLPDAAWEDVLAWFWRKRPR